MRTRKGGVVNKINDESIRTQVYRILSHPDTIFQYVSSGTYGKVFKVTYPDTDSGFEEGTEEKKQVKVFILKVQGIDMRIKHISEPEPDRSEEKYAEIAEIYPYSRKIEWDALTKEVRLQQKIIKCALDKHLMPPCPSILFYDAITAEKFETFEPGQLVYTDGYGKLEEIKSRDFKHYRMGIILMEYVQSEDLSNVPHERYEAKVYEIESKAFRAYFTALQCGVLQSDPKAQNFLLTEDDNVVLIDFGVAQELRPQEVIEFNGLLQHAEEGRYGPLRSKLNKLEEYSDNKCLDQLIFRPRWTDDKLIKSGVTKYPTLAPAIPLSKEIADQYKAGLSNPRSILPDREKLSAETIAEMKRKDERYAQIKADREAEEIYAEESARKKTRCEKEENGYCAISGGKRHTKYVGSRKRVGTRKKVQNRSF